MALSPEEQRLLDQLEASLAAEDPKLARTLGSGSRSHLPTRRMTLAVIAFIAGVALLILGMQTVWVLSVIGFLVMVVAVVTAFSGRPRIDQPEGPVRDEGGPDFMNRMEDRWRRRQQGQ